MKHTYRKPRISKLEAWYPWIPTARLIQGMGDMMVMEPIYTAYIMAKWREYEVSAPLEKWRN